MNKETESVLHISKNTLRKTIDYLNRKIIEVLNDREEFTDVSHKEIHDPLYLYLKEHGEAVQQLIFLEGTDEKKPEDENNSVKNKEEQAQIAVQQNLTGSSWADAFLNAGKEFDDQERRVQQKMDLYRARRKKDGNHGPFDV